MARDVDEVFIHGDMKRVFQPSAERMLTAARAFVQAWQEMRTVESTLKGGAWRLEVRLPRGVDARTSTSGRS